MKILLKINEKSDQVLVKNIIKEDLQHTYIYIIILQLPIEYFT